MNTVFTPKEIEIFKAWVQGRKNKEIAEALGVSESYVSQTVSKIQTKVNTLDNSFELLKDIGIIEPIKSLKLTDEGRKSFQRETLSFPKQTDKMMPDTWSFTSDSLEKTVVVLIRSLTDPLNMETPNELAKKIGIPINVVEATNNVLYQITHQHVSWGGVAPSLVVLVGGQMQPMLPEGYCNVGQQYAEGWT